MKRLIIFCLILTCIFVISSLPGYALQNGMYCGSFEMIVDNPTQCAPNTPGDITIINLDNDYLLFQNPWEEYTCKVTGSAIHCPPMDQVIDFTVFGLNAIVTNEASNGVGIILSDTEFKMTYSVRRNSCNGTDCDIVEQWMDVNFPCNVGPWISIFNLCD